MLRAVVFIKIDGRILNVVSFGGGETTLLGIGGWTGTWQLWRQPFELLSASWRCVAYDHRGAGQTQCPSDQLTLEGQVDDVFAVMDALEIERCWLAGESNGGLTGILAVLRDPSRFHGLVTISTPAYVDRTPEREAFIAALEQDREGTLRRFVQWCIPEPESDHLHRWLLHILLEAEPEADGIMIRNVYGVDVRPRLGELRQPVLVIHGEADVITSPDESKTIAAGIPRAELVLLKETGHVPNITRPREIANLIESLVRHHSS